MIIKDTITPNERGEREVIITDATAKHWADQLGVESLRALDDSRVRDLFLAVKYLNESQNHPIKTRYRNDAGEIELDPEELGEELYQAMRPEPASDTVFDPQYSEVGFTIRVMGHAASKAYREMVESSSNPESQRLEDIASGAIVALSTVLHPPNLA